MFYIELELNIDYTGQYNPQPSEEQEKVVRENNGSK